VDALEKLLAGVTFHVSSRSPIIEALFPHQKFPPLRRVPHEVAAKYQADFEKRARGGYVNRMLGGPDFAFAAPVLEQIRKSWSDYDACFSGASLSEEEATPIRQALIDAAEGLDLPLRQARLLAEAALSPVSGAFEASGIGARPKKRSARPAQDQAPAADVEADGPAGEPVEETAEVKAEEVPAQVEATPVEPAAPAAGSEAPAKPAKKKRAPKAPRGDDPGPVPEA
jgi:hypothetical protein